MIDILLMLWSCLLVVSFFSSYIIFDLTKQNTLAFFSIGMLLMGVIFMFFVNRKYHQVKKADYVLQKGYEKYIFMSTYMILFVINIAVIAGLNINISLTSPLLMLSWILPMICYSLYQSMWLCFSDTIYVPLQQEVQKLSCNKIKNITINKAKKNKLQIIITTKKEEFIYSSKDVYILQMKEYIATKNKNVKIQEPI